MSAERQQVAGVRFWVRRTNDAPQVDTALLRAAIEASEETRRALKQGRRKALFSFRHHGREYLVKVNRYRHGPRAWLRASKARREWTRALGVATRGISTPPLVAAGEERSATRRLRRCFTVVERVRDARDLAVHWREPLSFRERAALARTMGATVAALHNAGIHQDDLAPNNFLVVPGLHAQPPAVHPIDFERARLGARVSVRERTRALTKLHRYLYDTPRGLWWRFLLAYTGGDRSAARSVATAVAAEMPQLFRRDRSHLRHTVGHNNRRFRPLPKQIGLGWAHRGISDEEVDHLLRDDAAAAAPSLPFWSTPVAIPTPKEALAWWALAQALAQRGGLMARPLALARRRGASVSGDREAWLCLSARRPGESDATEAVAPGATRVLTARVRALGLGSPDAADVLGCSEAPGARLRVPPRGVGIRSGAS